MSLQASVCISISSDIPSEFRRPILGVRPRDGSVCRACMPVAAVDENSDPLTREHDVSRAAQLGNRTVMHSVAEAGRMDQSANSEFGRRVARLVCSHDTSRCGAAGPTLVFDHPRSLTKPRKGYRQVGCIPTCAPDAPRPRRRAQQLRIENLCAPASAPSVGGRSLRSEFGKGSHGRPGASAFRAPSSSIADRYMCLARRLIIMGLASDPAVLAHLNQVRELYADAGVIDYLRGVVTSTWSANLERWSPAAHFDDMNTLGYQTSRNVNNRITRTIKSSDVAPHVLADRQLGVAILGLDGFRLRVVKAPIESGLTPDMVNDFNWSTSATRELAARRNSSQYYRLITEEWVLEYGDEIRPSGRRNVDGCRDLFLVWAGELETDRTAGWLGLPAIGDDPWLGVLELWIDDPVERLHENEDSRPDLGWGANLEDPPYVDEDEDED